MSDEDRVLYALALGLANGTVERVVGNFWGLDGGCLTIIDDRCADHRAHLTLTPGTWLSCEVEAVSHDDGVTWRDARLFAWERQADGTIRWGDALAAEDAPEEAPQTVATVLREMASDAIAAMRTVVGMSDSATPELVNSTGPSGCDECNGCFEV